MLQLLEALQVAREDPSVDLCIAIGTSPGNHREIPVSLRDLNKLTESELTKLWRPRTWIRANYQALCRDESIIPKRPDSYANGAVRPGAVF